MPEPSGYRRVATDLATQIHDGRLPAGAALPAERDLAWSYGVAVLTVRRALDVLEQEGLIERQAGRRARVRRTPAVELVTLAPGDLVTVRRPTGEERTRLRLAGGELVVEVETAEGVRIYGSDRIVLQAGQKHD